MGDFMRLFRRQKSTTKSELPTNHVVASESFENIPSNVSQGSSVDVSVFNENSTTATHEDDDKFEDEKHVEGFKVPKSLRKSFRKLRWKKKDPSVSISSDNLSSLPKSTNESTNHVTPRKSSQKVNNRWSYSPDLCEENVPGAKELRGTLERKLSVKKEAEENPYRYHGERTAAWGHNSPDSPVSASLQKLSRQIFEEELDERSSPDEETSNSVQPIHSMGGSTVHVPQTLNLPSDLSTTSHLSQSEPAFNQQQSHWQTSEKGKSSPGLIQWASDEFNRQKEKYNSPKPGEIFQHINLQHYPFKY